jgi:hypothetical protein
LPDWFVIFIVNIFISDKPYCNTKERCDELWEAPNISKCINNTCVCTGGSEFVESSKTCECKPGHVIGHAECLPGIDDISLTTHLLLLPLPLNALIISRIYDITGEPRSSVSIMSGYGLDDRAIEIRSSAEAK